MKIILVTMPWAALDVPSLACGILKRVVADAMSTASVSVEYANLVYFDWAAKRHHLDTKAYNYYSLLSYFKGTGDWIFSSALYNDPTWRVAEFQEARRGDITDELQELSIMLHTSAPEWIEEYARYLVGQDPDVIGLTTTFQQNTASLALSNAIKRVHPETVVILGGANCDGEQGASWHKHFPDVDFVVRGEGEIALVQLLHALDEPQDLGRIPGLCWRNSEGTSVANPMAASAVPVTDLKTPDYDDYFDQYQHCTAQDWLEPKLVVEGARGCWWGAIDQCLFCGLNGSTIKFRSRPPERLLEDIISLSLKYSVLDIFVADNILDMKYLRTLLPSLISTGYDYRIQYEVKSNMRSRQVKALAEAGLVSVQPGIESLSSEVLRLMRKGVSGCQNVRFLRDAETHGLTVHWNYLYGFPGESPGDYRKILDQFYLLEHLPPMDGCTRIALERFSPYFDDPKLGFGERRPDEQYSLTYELPDAGDLGRIAYLFTTAQHGITGELEERLKEQTEEWMDSYPASRLVYYDLEKEIVISSRRRKFGWSVVVLRSPAELAMFRELSQPHSIESLAAALGQKKRGVDTGELIDLIALWRGLGLLFVDDDQYIHVAVQGNNQELHHLGRPDKAASLADYIACRSVFESAAETA